MPKSALDSSAPFGSLLLVVFTSILEVFILCLAGYILAGRGILDKNTQRQLNRLNVSLFTPALLFSKVAFFLTPEKLSELWVIPLFFIIVTVVSGAVAFVLGWLFRLKRSQRSFAMAAAMFMNSNSLPIALMQSLVLTIPGLKWGKDDNKNAMLGRALTYLVMYSTLGMVLRWSYGVRLLSQADPEVTVPDERTPLLSELHREDEELESQPATSTAASTILDDEVQDGHITHTHPSPKPSLPLPRRRTTFYSSFPNSPNRSRSNLDWNYTVPSAETPSNNNIGDTEVSTHRPKPSLLNILKKIGRFIRNVWLGFNDFMTVPLWAALASLIVACVPPLQNWLQFHAQPIKGAISSAGKCSIPITLIVLGAYFYPNLPEPTEAAANAPPAITTPSTSLSDATLIGAVKGLFRGKRNSDIRALSKRTALRQGEAWTVAISVISRMIITPLVLMPLIVMSAKYDFHAVFADPVFVLANVLLIASPPALTLAQITQAASGDAFERLISRTIFWSYCIATPPTTIIYVLVGITLTKI